MEALENRIEVFLLFACMMSEDVCHRHYKILAEKFMGFLQVHNSTNIPKTFKIHTVYLITMLCFVNSEDFS